MSALGSKLRTLQGGTVGFYCPGCDSMHVVRLTTDRDNWKFNGNGDTPTFQPSVLVRWGHHVPGVEKCYCGRQPTFLDPDEEPTPAACGVCHSFVTDGRIQFLADCTHSLAGKTVDLPDFP